MGSSDELFAAIEADDTEAVRSLIAADTTVAAARDAEGVSALMRMWYRSDGNVTLVEQLLARGADPEAENDDGATVLALTAQQGDTDVAARIREALA
jgi:ankyrin repeat protein